MIAPLDRLVISILEEEGNYNLSPFSEEGTRGFCLLWLIRRMKGYAHPFGKIICFGKEAGMVVPAWYAAVFSRHGLPNKAKEITEIRHAPGLQIESISPHKATFVWHYRAEYSAEYGDCIEVVQWADIPHPIRKKMQLLLGDAVPSRSPKTEI